MATVPGGLDIVGTAAVDVVPIAPLFHEKMRAIALPAADRVGEEAGRRFGDAMSRHITVAIPNAINNGGQAGRQAATRQGNANAGAFARSFENRLRAAFQSLPRPDVRLSDTGFNADLARLRARMESLTNKRIGVDIDAQTAIAEMQAIDLKLLELGSRSPNIQVRADIATARAELAAMQRQVDDLDRDDVQIKVCANTSQANAALLQLAVSLGVVAAIPVVPIVGAAIGAIASAAVTAAAGVGAVALAAIPAIKGVTSVIQAKTAAEKEAAQATDNSAAADKRAAQSAIQMANAQQSLTSAHRNAARSIEQANRQVADAERSLAQAGVRAMEQREQAAERVEDAERSLTDAKRDARSAEEALREARKDAARQLQDLQDRLAGGALDEREAALRVQEAYEELQATLADPTATDLQRERSQLAYDEAVQGQKEQAKEYKRLKESAAEQAKAGIDGNEGVQRATEAVADAQRKVGDQREALADANKEAARVEVEAAQAIVDAQRNLASAVENASLAQIQAAESIASAERGVEAARLSSIDTTANATTKADEYREALAKLTPEQRALYESLAGSGGLIEAFKAWSAELQPDVLPLFVDAVNGAKNSLPGLTPLVKNSADAVGELMDRASADMKEPFWQRFKEGIAENAKPAIVGLGISFGNVFKGMAGIVDAFFPHMDSISQRMQDITGRFANWGTNLRGSPEFEDFLDYVSEHGPSVGEAFGDIAEAVFDVAHALEPFSRIILELLGYVADAISYVAEHAPWAIQLMYGLWIATRLWTIAMASNPIGLVILGLVGLALAVKYAWENFEWFRDIVTAAWDGISGAAMWAYDKVLYPIFSGIRDALKWVGDQAVWLWQDVFSPVWNGIVLVVKYAVTILLTVLITPLWLAIQGLGLLFAWLYEDMVKPSWDLIAAVSTWLWTNVLSPFFGLIWDGIQWVGDKFVWLYDHAVKPSGDWIAAKATWLWEKALSPALKWIWDGLTWLGEKFVWLYDHSVGPAAGWIAEKTDWLYEKGLKPTFDSIKSAVGFVADAFEDAKKNIGLAWDQLKDIAKAPVNFIIEWVYTKGIKAVWDKVASYVGLDPLPKGPKLLAAGGTVGDGWGIAAPMRVNKPTAIVGEGNPLYPEYVIPTDPKYRARALALHQQAGTQLLESGGILGSFKSAWDWSKDTIGDVIGTGIDWAKTATDVFTDPGKVWDALTRPILARVADGIGTSPMAQALTRIPSKMVDGLKTTLTDSVTGVLVNWGGAWTKPVDAPYGTRFGASGSMWASGHHTGLDFPAQTGTPVRAVSDGRVTSTGSTGPYGNHLTVSHGGGLSSLYAHLSRILVDVGQRVADGQMIGRVGATGNVTGPHLHLEARVNGKAVDPMQYLTGGATAGKSPDSAKAYAKSILSQYGWGSAQFPALEKLWEGESNWRWNAENPSSGAYGIPQSLPASKMATVGADWKTNPATQIRWGLNYIKSRPDYGSPSAAYAKWLSRSPHWYDDGGYLQPGLNLVANGTGKPEPVFTSGQWADIRASKGGGTPKVDVYVSTTLDGQELTGHVDRRIEIYDRETATDLNNGRWE